MIAAWRFERQPSFGCQPNVQLLEFAPDALMHRNTGSSTLQHASVGPLPGYFDSVETGGGTARRHVVDERLDEVESSLRILER